MSLASSRTECGVRRPLTWLERRRGVAQYFLTVYKNTWRGSVIGRFASPLLFLVSIGLGLGGLVDRSAGGVGGHPYLQFVVPAITMTQAMWVALGECTYQVMAYIKWNRMYDSMLATPLTIGDVVSGHLGVVAVHATMATTVFVAIAALFGGYASWWALMCVPIGLLTAMAFAAPIFAFTATQDGDDGFSILYRMVATPLMLFSGTFFPVAQLPAVMQALAWVTPLWHGVELSRAAAYGELAVGPALVHLAVLVAYIVGGVLWARHTFTRRLRR